MNRRAALLVLILFVPPPGLARATPGDAQLGEASRFVSDVGRELPGLLAGTATPAERQARLAPFLERVVDLDGAARFCLGRFWRAASPEQQREYRALFARALAAAIAMRADVYAAGTNSIAMLPEVAAPDDVEVRTIVSSAGQAPVRVTWLVDATRRPFRIVDVQAEGISLRLTLRSDYNAYLSRNGGNIAQFIDNLRAHAR